MKRDSSPKTILKAPVNGWERIRLRDGSCLLLFLENGQLSVQSTDLPYLRERSRNTYQKGISDGVRKDAETRGKELLRTGYFRGYRDAKSGNACMDPGLPEGEEGCDFLCDRCGYRCRTCGGCTYREQAEPTQRNGGLEDAGTGVPDESETG